MDSLIVIITIDLLRGRARLRPWSRDDQDERRGARLDHEVVGRPRGPAVPVPADRAVHRVLQLLEHGAGRGRQARRLARGGQHRRGLAADRVRARDDAGRPDHAGGDRQVGHPRADLHPALPPARRRAADRARRLPRRRLAVQRGHAADGLLPADHHLRAALQEGRRDRHRRRDDAARTSSSSRSCGRRSSSPGTCSGSRSARARPCTSTSAAARPPSA